MGTEQHRPVKKIGKYEILAELGKGAMGVVYKAQDPFLGRFVAIKTMSSTLMDDPDLLQRFYREAQSAGNLRHANIVTIYDLGEENGIPYIAMEFLEGHDLEEIIRLRTPLNLFKKLNIIAQICRGLDYAHKHGIIHRDVKPANVRILPDGDVKIVDFGIARITGSNITRPDLVMGTVNYMSPEQIQAPKDIDRRSDLFSVGVIMYEFLTYQKPFTGDTIPTILFKIINEPIAPLSKYLPGCPHSISDIVEKALSKNPNQRFRTCDEMAQEIDSVMENLKPQVIQELLEAGHRQLQSNDFLAAQKQYYEVLEIDGSHKIAKTILRRIEEEQKKFFQDQQVKNLLQQAAQLVRQNEFDEAIKCCQEAQQLDPQNTEIKRLIFETQEKKTYALKRQDFQVIFKEAHKLSLEGRLENAFSAVERALKIFPHDAEALGLRKSIQDELALRDRRRKVSEILTQAREILIHKQYEEAAKLLQQALQIDPGHRECHELLEYARREQQEAENRRVLEEKLTQAKSQISNRQYDIALKTLQEAAGLAPADPRIERLATMARAEMEEERKHQLRSQKIREAKTLLGGQQYLEAIATLESAEQLAPKDPEILRLLSMARQELAQVEQEQYLRMELAKARGFMQQSRYSDAIAILAPLAKQFPNHYEIRKNLERVQAEGEAEEKRASRDRFIKTARQQIAERKFGDALVTLYAARQENPNDPEILSLIQFSQTENETLERTTRISDLQQEAKELLSRKRYDDARRVVARAREIDIEDPELQRIAALIDQQAAIDSRKIAVSQAVAGAKDLIKAKKYPEAVERLQHALARYPGDFELETLLKSARDEQQQEQYRSFVSEAIAGAKDLIKAKKYQEAVERLQHALARHPGDFELETLLKSAREEQQQEQYRSFISEVIAGAKDLMKAKNYEGAADKLQEALQKYPRDFELESLLKLAREEEQQEKHRSFVSQAVTAAKDLMKAKRYQEAVDKLQQALARFPRDFELETLLKLAREEQQQEQYRSFVSQQVKSVTEALNRLDFVGAIRTLQEALKKYPRDRELTTLLQQVEEQKAKQEKITALKNQLEATSVLISEQKFDQAIQSLQKLKKERPEEAALIDVYLRRAEESREASKAAAERTVLVTTPPLEIPEIPEIPVRKAPIPPPLVKPVPTKKPFPIAIVGIAAGIIAIAVVGYYIMSGVGGAGDLLVLSDPDGASILLNDKPVGITASGRLQLTGIQPGNYAVIARKEGYADAQRQVTVAKGKNPDISLKLNAAGTTLRVRAGQPGVRVLVQGKEVGITASDGTASISNLPVGIQPVTLYKEGFVEWKKEVDFKAGLVAEINETLKPLTVDATVAALRVATEPPEASVLLDGREVGITKGGSLTLQGLKPGTVTLLIRKEGYADAERNLDLAAGRVLDQRFVLIGKPAGLQLITNAPEAVVQVDGQPVGKTDASGKYTQNSVPGKRQAVQVLKDGYEPYVDFVDFKPGQTAQLNWKLVPRTAAATSSGMTVSSSPDNADVYLDDKPVARTPTASIPVPAGKHKVSVKKDKYRDAERIIDFRVGEPQALPFTLEKMRGVLEINAQPEGVMVGIGGASYDTTTHKQIELEPGTYTVQLSKSGYATKQESVIIRDQQTSLLRTALDKIEAGRPAGGSSGAGTPVLAGGHTEAFITLEEWEAPGGWQADNSVLRAKGAGIAQLKDRIYKNFNERFSLRLANGIAAAWIVRAQDNQNYYLIQINGERNPRANLRNTIFFYICRDGKVTGRGNFPLPFTFGKDPTKKPPEWLDVLMEVRGNTIIVKGSGTVFSGTKTTEKELGRFEDPAGLFPAGKTGFLISGNEEFEITSLIVEPIG